MGEKLLFVLHCKAKKRPKLLVGLEICSLKMLMLLFGLIFPLWIAQNHSSMLN